MDLAAHTQKVLAKKTREISESIKFPNSPLWYSNVGNKNPGVLIREVSQFFHINSSIDFSHGDVIEVIGSNLIGNLLFSHPFDVFYVLL